MDKEEFERTVKSIFVEAREIEVFSESPKGTTRIVIEGFSMTGTITATRIVIGDGGEG